MDDFQYPARLEIHYREKQSRISAFFRLILALPALLIASLLGALTSITHLLAGVWIVILGFYPKWLFDINLLSCRLQFKTIAYLYLLIDEYPLSDHNDEISIEVDFPDPDTDLARLMPLVKWILVIPHLLVASLLYGLYWCIAPIAWLLVLFLGNYPRPLFDFSTGVLRWLLRIHAYASMLATDVYPPFALRP
ncbi:MAG: DUF4389 domain-containing protein [Rhodothermaceae bacterium]|nr:DUF4389 domain-containing protein [Rhodothermaceae bacterium]MYF40021.1 DUF4389 domain-containing protein [Rhodothermaceae bacterium]